MSNVERYLQQLFNCFVHDTVKVQIEAFKEGFEKVFPIELLKFFDSQELEVLIGGGHNTEDWSI